MNQRGLSISGLALSLFGWRRDDGQTLVEYALVLVLIAVVVVVVLTTLGATINSVLYGRIVDAM